MPASSSEPASGLQDALNAVPNLLGRDEIAPVGRRDAALNRLGKTRILIEKAGDGLLGEFIDLAPVACRQRGKLSLLLGREVNLHARETSIAGLGIKRIDAAVPPAVRHLCPTVCVRQSIR